MAEADGTFTVHGPTDKGIPPGTYMVAVRSEIYSGDGTNRFEDKYDIDNTTLTAEVGPEENQVFLIDMKAGTVQKQ